MRKFLFGFWVFYMFATIGVSILGFMVALIALASGYDQVAQWGGRAGFTGIPLFLIGKYLPVMVPKDWQTRNK